MKLLCLHQFDLNLAGGSGVYLRSLVAAARQMGHQVEVVSARWPDRYDCTTCALPFSMLLTFGPEKRPGEYTLDELDETQLDDLTRCAFTAIEQHLRRSGKPDLILANHISLTARLAQLLANHLEIPYRLISYGTDTALLIDNLQYRKQFIPATIGCDLIFAISAFVARQIQSLVPNCTVEVLGGAVHTAHFFPGPAPLTLRRLAFVGRLVTEKGLWTLLDALEQQSIATELIIAGEGPLYTPLAAVLAERRLEARVKLLGYVPPDRLRDILLQAALLVVPSLWQEPLGLVVLEALACGLPVVASQVGGIPEMIAHGKNGWLVPPGNAAALAAALDWLLTDPSRLQNLQAGCLAHSRIVSYQDLVTRVTALPGGRS